jgi:hypothetical protein
MYCERIPGCANTTETSGASIVMGAFESGALLTVSQLRALFDGMEVIDGYLLR